MGNVRISDDLHRKVRALAEKRLGSIGEWVNKFITEGLERERKRARRKAKR